MARLRNRVRRGVLVAIGLVAAPLTYVAHATHTFSDVPTTAFYHSAVEWMANRIVTSGCAPGLYCPTDNVNRAQMAVFMRNLGVALTPTVLTVNGTPGATDLDSATTIVCPTTSNYTPAYPQRAILYAKASFEGPGDFSYWIFPMFSTNSGTTWSSVGGFTNSPEASAPTAAHQVANFTIGYQDLVPGTTYRFAIRPLRPFTSPGTADPSEGWCGLHVEIVNRNPGSSPLIREEGAPEGDQRQFAAQ